MNGGPLISVVTTVHNGMPYLPEAVASIRRQTFGDWEHIIVDDASADGTGAFLSQLAKTDSRVKILRNETCMGPYPSANRALQQACGKYVARIDADDISFPNRFERQFAFIESNPQVNAVFSYADAISTDGRVRGTQYRPPCSAATLKWALCLQCHLVHSAAFIRRDALLEKKGYSERGRYSQDYRLWCEFSREGALGVIPEVLAHYRQHPRQISRALNAEQTQCAMAVLRDHLTSTSSEPWNEAEVETLFRAANGQPAPLARGLRALERWNDCWGRDPTLSEIEKEELGRLYLGTRKRFTRRRIRRRPLEVFGLWSKF